MRFDQRAVERFVGDNVLASLTFSMSAFSLLIALVAAASARASASLSAVAVSAVVTSDAAVGAGVITNNGRNGRVAYLVKQEGAMMTVLHLDRPVRKLIALHRFWRVKLRSFDCALGEAFNASIISRRVAPSVSAYQPHESAVSDSGFANSLRSDCAVLLAHFRQVQVNRPGGLRLLDGGS